MKRWNCLIYGLVDPRNGMLRYVGWSSNGMGRPIARHAAKCRNWEKSLKNAGVKKQVVIFQEFPELAACSKDEVNAALKMIEPGWIAHFKKMGFDLTNMTDGGEGAVGRVKSEQERRKISQRMTGAGNPMFGKPSTAVGKPGWMTGVKGEAHPMHGYRHNAENRKKMSEAAKAYWSVRR